VDDILPKVNASLLRDAADGRCARRIAGTHRGARGNKQANVRFRVLEAVREQAAIAQIELGPPRAEAFVADQRWFPEERAVFDIAVRWYLALFGEPAVVIDLDDDIRWSRDLPDLGVRVTSESVLALENASGRRELRFLRLAGRARDPATDPGVGLAVLRLESLAAGNEILIRDADLIHGAREEVTVDPAARAAATLALVERDLPALQTAVADPRPRIGIECGWCAYVAGCEAHRG